MQSNPSCEQLNKRVELYCTTNKAWRYVFIPRLPLRLEIGNGDSWSRITASFSRKSRISNFCHRYPKHNSLSQSASVPFGKFRFPASSQIPHPSTFSRIPHCLLVKSRIPSTFSRIPHCLLVKSRIASTFSRNPALPFGQIPYPVNVFPNPAMSFGQIPHLENTLPDIKSVQDIQHCSLSCDNIYSHRSVLIEDQWYSWRIAQLPLPWEQIIQHHIQSRFCHGLFFSRNTPSSG